MYYTSVVHVRTVNIQILFEKQKHYFVILYGTVYIVCKIYGYCINQEMVFKMQEVVGSNPTEGTKIIYFSHFTLLEWNVKNCFVTNIKTIKLIKNQFRRIF